MLKRCFNGFQTFHGTRLHGFSSLILYSTSAASKDGITNPLMVEYLVKSIGFSEKAAISIVTKTKVSHRFKSTEKSELVVEFFKNSGFDETHIRKVFASEPKILRSSVEKTLKPKIRFFQDLGVSGFELGLLLSQHPQVLTWSLKAHIAPCIELLKSLIGSNEHLVRFLLKVKTQKLLNHHFLKHIPNNVLLLQSYGVSMQKIKAFMLRRPLFLSQRSQWVENVVKGVEEKLHIPRTSGMFLHGVDALSKISHHRFKQWCDVFRVFGWSETEISLLLRTHPLCTSLSTKELQAKLKYFMEDLGYGSDYLASHPGLITYSMKKKILPRSAFIQALKDKGLLKRNISIYTIMSKAESRFLEMYVLPFKDKLPELYKYYTQMTSRSLSKP